ncbi:MAG: hypothetical protein FWH42_02540 [Dehalococcoidia bacterium]|nr:hypothetical protein [Dehalococcoidia bacterium]
MKKSIFLAIVYLVIISVIAIGVFSSPNYASADFPVELKASIRVIEFEQEVIAQGPNGPINLEPMLDYRLVLDFELLNTSDKTIQSIRAFFEVLDYKPNGELCGKYRGYANLLSQNYINIEEDIPVGRIRYGSVDDHRSIIPLKSQQTRSASILVMTYGGLSSAFTFEVNLYISWVKFSRGGWGSPFSIPQWEEIYEGYPFQYPNQLYPSAIEYDLDAVTLKINLEPYQIP